jgi:pimeloyl-ACP methyl ester carboxylesterase
MRYIRYLFVYRRLNTDRCHRDTNHNNIKKLLKDLNKYPDVLDDLICDLFFNKIRLEDMKYDEVCTTLYEMIGEDPQYQNDIKKLVKRFQLHYKEKYNRDVFKGDIDHARIRHYKHNILSWFNILPFYLLTKGVFFVVAIYMRILGYRSHTFKSGLKIRYNKFDKSKGTPLVFFHASVGGVSVQINVLDHFHQNHNIIMPEIPGVSFLDVMDRPPPISEIIDNVHEFILEHYIDKDAPYVIDPSKLKINLMGHSLGSTMCSAYVNKYPKHIDSLFSVEGQIFFPRSIRVVEDFNAKLDDIPCEDLITVPLFHRDLYVQYFFVKRITLDYAMIYDMEGAEHIKIYMYHVKDDRRVLIRPQLEYAKRKNIQIIYTLFEGNYSHGSFATNSKIRSYVLNDINRIYVGDNHVNTNILVDKETIPTSISSETIANCTNITNESDNMHNKIGDEKEPILHPAIITMDDIVSESINDHIKGLQLENISNQTEMMQLEQF